MLRKMYGPSAEEVRRKWCNFQNEELQYLSRNLMEGLGQITDYLGQDS